MEDVKVSLSLQTTIVMYQISALKQVLSNEQLSEYDKLISEFKSHLLSDASRFSEQDLNQIEKLLK